MCMKKKRKKRNLRETHYLEFGNWRRRSSRKMPTKEEKQSSSGGGSASGGTTTVNSTNTTTSSGSGSGNNSCSSEKHKYCLLCNRNDFTLNTFNATIEKDLRAIFNTEVIKTALSCAYIQFYLLSVLIYVCFIIIFFLFPSHSPHSTFHDFPFNFRIHILCFPWNHFRISMDNYVYECAHSTHTHTLLQFFSS